MEEKKKYKVGYCPGSFDMFHRGHLNLLKRSKEMCDYLIAGVVTDEVYTGYKLKPPVIPFEDRLEIVAQCKYVDKAIPVTPYLHDKWNAWLELHYDAHFAGSDHAGAWPELERSLNEVGSELVFFPYTDSVSSTMIKTNLEKDCFFREMVGINKDPIIVLFGAGTRTEQYLDTFVGVNAPKRLSDNRIPSFIVDNSPNKWGTYLRGIEIKSPDSLLEIPRDNLCIMITPDNRTEIVNQLLEMGIRDYSLLDPSVLASPEVINSSKSLENQGESSDLKLKKIRTVQLEMLDFIEEICAKHDLTYYAIFGTLLGAVRHNGFIPWDDDMDIAMPREDYELFKIYAEEELPDYYYLQTAQKEKNLVMTNMRIRDSRTTGIEEWMLEKECNKGIWIDIDSIDVNSEEDRLYRKKINRINHYYFCRMARIEGFNSVKGLLGGNSVKAVLYQILSHLASDSYWLKKYEHACSERLGSTEPECGIFMPPMLYRQLSSKDFAKTVRLPFEDRTICAPIGYEHVLYGLYGSDYMLLPPKEEQVNKHRGIFDPERPYTDYESLFCNIFKDAEGKQIILFGAGQMFDDYMRKWGGKYRPVFTVDNDESKWGKTRLDVAIKSPDEILKIPEKKRKVIICSFYYREIEQQLKEMGIDYSIYVQNVEWIVNAEKVRQRND